MAKYKVLVTSKSFFSLADAKDFLEANDCEVVRPDASKPLAEEVAALLPTVDAVIAGLEPYTEELIASAPNLKVISRYGVGYDKVDLAAAAAHDVKVTITVGANENSVADLAMALMLSAARHVPVMDRTLKEKASVRPVGVEMWQKTLGVVGGGRIGKGVCKRASGFGMKILCYDVVRDEAFAKEYGVTYVDLETLLREADFITLHVPLFDSTRNMIGKEQFDIMKPTAVIVNTARGGVIDEDALYTALKTGKIAAAGLDATVEEPAYNSPLTTLDNCILTPHAGATTIDAVRNMGLLAAENALDVLRTGSCRYTVSK